MPADGAEEGEVVVVMSELCVSVLSTTSLKGSKADAPFKLSITSEFAGLSKVADKDAAVPVSTELTFSAEPTDISHSETFEVVVHTQEGIELLANNSVVITLWEGPVADAGGKAKKKAKAKEAEEKPLGTITVPLTAIVFDAKQEMTGSYPVQLVTPDEGEDAVAPTCQIRVAMSKPLMSDEQLAEGNLMTVSVDGAYSIPEQFVPAAANISYGLNIPLPIGGTGRMFNGGVAITGEEPHERPTYNVDNTGKDAATRTLAETEANYIEFSGRASRSVVFLDKASQREMISQISRKREVAVEFRRYSKEAAKGGKGTKVPKAGDAEEMIPGFHGMGFADVSSLIYPGSTEIAVASNIAPYDEGALSARVGLSREEIDRIYNPPKPGQKERAPPKKDPAMEEATKEQSAVYAEAGCYAVVRISLTKPLIAKRTAQSYAASISELIPVRDLYPTHTMTGEAAVTELHTQVTAVAKELLEQFRGKQEAYGTDVAAIRQSLYYELNTTGKFYAFKEQIKRSVIKVVREKFRETSAIKDPTERQTFLATLYSFLIEEMHKTLNESFAFSTSDLVAPVTVEVEDIENFAVEAEGRGLLNLASKYHQECCARRRTDVRSWYNYGCFNMRAGDLAKAEECFREAVSLNQEHAPSILLAAVISWSNEEFDVATNLFEVATHYQGNSVTWAVRGLFHTLLDDSISADMCMLKACAGAGGKKQAFIDTAKFLLQLNLPAFLEGALREIKLEFGGEGTSEVKAIFAEYHISKGESNEADEVLSNAIETDISNACLWTLKGHMLFKNDKLDDARAAYQRALDLPGENPDYTLVRLRVAELYLQNEQFEEAKGLYLEAAAASPSALSWEGVGIACYRLGSLSEAEKALAESNIFDNTTAQVWAYLSLICLQCGRRREAEQTFKYAVRHGLQEGALAAEVAREQKRVGFGYPFLDGDGDGDGEQR